MNSGVSLIFLITIVFISCSHKTGDSTGSDKSIASPAFSFEAASVEIPSPANVHLAPGGRFYSRYQGNISYLQYQHDHFAPFMLGAFASRQYNPGKLLERVWDREYAGKWIDAATRSAVNSGDPEPLKQLDAFVESLLKYQQKDGYLGIPLPYDRELNDWEKEWDNWNLWNALNGLLTHYELRGSVQSLEAASRIGKWMINNYGPLTRSNDPFLKGEVIDAFTNVVVIGQLVRLYRHTGDQDYLDFTGQAIRYYPPIQQMLSTGEPYLIHPYMLSAVLGGLLSYARETEDYLILEKVEHVWESMRENHLFPTGSLGESEDLDENPIQDVPGGQLQETCATTEWIFLNTQLYEITGKERYISALERTCYNALLGAQSDDGMRWCYWTPLCYSKDWFHGPTRCCYWSGPRGIARIPQLIYAVKENIIYVNLFESSKASMSAGGKQVQLTQESKFPGEGKSHILIDSEEGWSGTLRIRVPEWSSGFKVSMNGAPLSEILTEPGYMDFHLQKKEKHHLLISFEIPLILEALNSEKSDYVIRRGPEVLSIDMRDNIDTWLGQDDLISLPQGMTFLETESFTSYSWPGPALHDINRRLYRVEVEDVRTDDARSVILTPYADAGNDGAAFRTAFPLSKEKP